MIKLKTNIVPSVSQTMTELMERIGKLDQDKEYTVYVSDRKNTRTLQQNKYYWGIILPVFSGHTGILKEDLHELCKYKFNKGIITDPESGEIYDIPKSTKTLKKDEFQQYIAAVKEWALELGCFIPEGDDLPDEVLIYHDKT